METKVEALQLKPKLGYKGLKISYEGQTGIGFKDVKKLLSWYSKMLTRVKPENRSEVEGKLDFFLSNRIKNFDITFIAALNLIKFSFKNIQITLRFDRFGNFDSEEGKCYHRFGHFYTAGALAYGEEVYRIILDGKPQELGYFRERLTGYLPFIYVEKESIKNLFYEPFKITWDNWWEQYSPFSADIFVEKITSDEEIYQALREFIIKKLDLENAAGNKKNNLDNFYMNYIFKAARNINFIKKILKNQAEIAPTREKDLLLKISGSPLGIKLAADGDRKYEREVQIAFDKILGKPPAFVILFSYFIEKFYNTRWKKKGSDENEIKKRVEAISNIFHFTNEIFYGLKELVKNIVEHSSTGRGIIIGRVLDRKNLAILKKEMHIESYIKNCEENEYIDLIVLDDGSTGIIEKTIQNLQKLTQEFRSNPNALAKFDEDIQNLSQDKVVLGDFFDLHEIKLNYQQIRSALSLGLLIFSHLVRENNGFMMVSSPHRDKIDGLVLFKDIVDKAAVDNIVPMGTFYNIIFPKNLKRSLTPRSEIVPFEMPSGESAFMKLSRLIRNCDEIPKQTLNGEVETDSYRDRLCLLDIEPEIYLTVEKLRDIFRKCEGCLANGKSQKILALNLEKIASTLDPLDLFKYLANLQITKDIKSIIVYNVLKETVKRIIELFEIFKALDFKIGSNDHFVLFYYTDQEKTGGDDERKAWVECSYSFLLAGENWDDLYWINKKIEKSNYTQKDLLDKWINEKNIRASEEFQNNYIANPLFTPEGHLVPFDVVIEKKINKRVLTLFEWNVMADLNKVAGPFSSRSYKFIDAHMRLGSKIHISDFFYARRIFQNSFYSLRFAFLITRYIEQQFASRKEEYPEGTSKKKQLTIVGYGMYSELLISNIARFLRNIHHDWEIEHALIDEGETPKVTGKIYSEILLVIPISSTLSTSLKIVQHLKKNYSSSNIKELPINVMLVGNGELEGLVDGEGNVTDKTVQHFWKKIDINNNIITTRSHEKEEKFFLFLSSKWYLPQDCLYCFPTTVPTDESVLFETDKVSFTPSLIFEFPPSKGKTSLSAEIFFGSAENKKEDEAKAVISPEILIYGHASRENNHYLYYIETRDFLRLNKKSLEEWLGNVKTELKQNNKENIFESKIVLIAPAHDTNADFLNLVNEVVFNDVATIFHYEQNEDYIQNLRSFFGVDITRDAYVFYIDDAVSSGKTFEKIDNFVKYAREDYNRGVDGAFVLINRLTQDRYSVLTREVQKGGFFSFVDLDVPIMIDSEKFCHLCVEKKKFEKMLDETILDPLRILIKCKTWKLEPREYTEYLKFKQTKDAKALINFESKYFPPQKYIFFNLENQQKYLQRLEIVHRLYRGFSNDAEKQKIEEIIRGYRSLKELWEAINISHVKPAELTEDEKVSLIKVLSYPYFVYYKDIRKYIFKSIIRELDRVISALINTISTRDLMDNDYDSFKYLKFLIRRSAALKANYLIHKEVLIKIILLIDYVQDKLEKDTGDKEERDLFTPMLSGKIKEEFVSTVNQFVDFFTLAVKEAVWYNEAKSIRLEKTLDAMIDGCGKAAGTCSLLTDAFRIENISILFQFINLVKDEISGIDSLHFTERHYVEDHQSLSEKLIRYCLDNPYRSSSLLSFLGLDMDIESIDISTGRIESFLGDSTIFNDRILPALLLKTFFLNEKKEKGGKGQIKTKMNYTLFLLCKILGIDSDEGGAFFVVKPIDTSNRSLGANMYMVGHIGMKKEMYSFEWSNTMIMKVFDGYFPKPNSLPITYLQVIKKESGYFSQYGQEIKCGDISEIKYLPDMNVFVFLRIAAADENCISNGGLVFYSQQIKPIPSEIFRYALLLKNEIYEFLKKNYDNDSFRLWIENEKIDGYFGDILHRVKQNIVNFLQNRTVLLPDGKEDIEYKDILNNIDKKLLSYSKILSRYKNEKICEIDFSGIFNKIIEEFENTGFSGKICYNKAVTGKLWLKVPVPVSSELNTEGIFADLLTVIVDNILENAFDKSKGNASQVDIDNFIENAHVVIRIKDNGVGIKSKLQVLNGSIYSQHGLGLGIQIISDTVVGLLGGNFDLKSTEDGIDGVLIIIRLPVHKEKVNG